jgi:hypothetical protein
LICNVRIIALATTWHRDSLIVLLLSSDPRIPA